MSCNTDHSKLYEEWKEFLAADRPDLRLAAVAAVLQIRDETATAELVAQGFVPLLLKNTNTTTALQALVHLSSTGPSANQCVEDLLESRGIPRMLELALGCQPSEDNPDWKRKVNYSMALLANMTRVERGSLQLLQNAASLDLLLKRFQKQPPATTVDYTSLDDSAMEANDSDPYQHFAAMLMNVTQCELGRKYLLKLSDEKSLLQDLLPQLRSPNPLRRRGLAGTIRNVCLERDSAWWLLNVVNIGKHILYPLAGPEELDVDEKQGLDPDLWLEGPDKVREPDHLTRLFLCQAVLLLCRTGRQSRQTLRLARTYVILKWADMVEEYEDVSVEINDCVQFLRRDEEGTAEGSSDQLITDTYAKPITSNQVRAATEDYDDVD